ncbi:MAG: DUF29 domain-containing protein, partial [Hydrogenobacter thermophilus]|nr:DUF29 domain-containing protein [Hydrogenobacter thermophilus]
ETAGRGWIKSVNTARGRVLALLDIYPSLKSRVPTELESAWKMARRELESWLINNDQNPEDFHIPKECPYTYEEAMTRDLRKEIKP